MGANSNNGKPIMLNQYVQTENLEIIIKKYLDFKTVPRAFLITLPNGKIVYL